MEDMDMRAGVWPDEQLLRFFSEHRTAWGTGFARIMMDAGTNTAVLAVGFGLALAFVVVRRAYRPAGAVTIAVLVSTIAAAVLKEFFDRARPPAEFALVHLNGASMPSTHATRTAAAAAAVLLAVTWSTSRARLYWGAVLACGTVVVGVCLVYLGDHWATDVVAGSRYGHRGLAPTRPVIVPCYGTPARDVSGRDMEGREPSRASLGVASARCLSPPKS